MSKPVKQIEDNISKIDKNFEVKCSLEQNDIEFYDSKSYPFCLYGLYKDELNVFKRMPEDVAESVSDGVKSLNFNTAGIRVRFKTDSDYIAIKCIMPTVTMYSHMPLTAKAGFDMYEVNGGKYTYVKTFVPPIDMKAGYESIAYVKGGSLHEYEINFPLYNRVSELYIGVRQGSSVDRGSDYKYSKPVLYYGSSITQGGCASKPGNSYEAIISHDLDCDYINLGFSGCAKGETEIAKYIASLDVSVFVCDYDYNAPSEEHLRSTHLPMYKIFRESNPKTPIIFVSAPCIPGNKRHGRKQIIFDTYKYASENGDKNVYFVEGDKIYDERYSNVYTVDGTHPNDAGFLRMAEVIGRKIKICIS